MTNIKNQRNNKFISLKTLALSSFVLALTLSGCSNTPSHLIVSPELNTNIAAVPQYLNKNINLSVQDVRANSHFVQILSAGEAATLINGHSDLAAVVQAGLSTALAKQGLSTNSMSSNQLQVNIEKALINVNQSLLNYETDSEITLSAVLANGQETLTKNFRVKGQSNGPFSPDLAVLGRDFNQQLTKAMNQLINDPDIQRLVK
ncbi:MAG: YajG family lipoprotein [Thalassotalea sp.]